MRVMEKYLISLGKTVKKTINNFQENIERIEKLYHKKII